MCPYVASCKNSLEKHKEDEHEITEIKCAKCEYIAEDNGIMRKHKMNHTGKYPFFCGTCEFEATKQSILTSHMKIKHKQKYPETQDPKEMCGCNGCEKQYAGSFQFRHHVCHWHTVPTC